MVACTIDERRKMPASMRSAGKARGEQQKKCGVRTPVSALKEAAREGQLMQEFAPACRLARTGTRLIFEIIASAAVLVERFFWHETDRRQQLFVWRRFAPRRSLGQDVQSGEPV